MYVCMCLCISHFLHHRKQAVSPFETRNMWMIFREIISLCYDNRTKHNTNSVNKMQNSWIRIGWCIYLKLYSRGKATSQGGRWCNIVTQVIRQPTPGNAVTLEGVRYHPAVRGIICVQRRPARSAAQHPCCTVQRVTYELETWGHSSITKFSTCMRGPIRILLTLSIIQELVLHGQHLDL